MGIAVSPIRSTASCERPTAGVMARVRTVPVAALMGGAVVIVGAAEMVWHLMQTPDVDPLVRRNAHFAIHAECGRRAVSLLESECEYIRVVWCRVRLEAVRQKR